MEHFDLVVIGAGPGGYPAAIRGAQLGAKVAIVEREQIGGTCLNWGCIPTKTLIAASGLFAEMKHAQRFGIRAGALGVDFASLMQHKKNVVSQLQNGVKQLLKANNVTVLDGSASFSGRNSLRITGAGGTTEISAAKTIVATGSTSIMPGFLPKDDKVVDSRAFLSMEKLPTSMIVLGGGYIGCELACMAAQLGTNVTIVELLEDILLLVDEDIRREIRKHMQEALGIQILTGKAFANVTADGNSVRGMAGDVTVQGELLLASVGRRPVTDGLAMENAGLKTDGKGFLTVDDYGRTSATTIYAIGDVTGRIQLAHSATSQGVIAAENACTRKLRKFENLVPAVIFTAPEAAYVGLSEQAAAALGLGVKVGKFPFRALGRALAAGQADGFVKLIADATSGRLLGAAVVGLHATDLISEAAVAIRNEMTLDDIGGTIHAHPTFGELWMEAAHAAQGHAIHAAPVKRRA
ncbi:MAG: dihydrolipoyl dehydrogenase [bacterium]